jgi:hypothetical protein
MKWDKKAMSVISNFPDFDNQCRIWLAWLKVIRSCFTFIEEKKIDFSDMKMCSRNIKKVKKSNHFNISFKTNFYSSLWTDQLIIIINFQNPFFFGLKGVKLFQNHFVYSTLEFTNCSHIVYMLLNLSTYSFSISITHSQTHTQPSTFTHTHTYSLSHTYLQTHTHTHTHTHTDQNWTHSLWRNIVRHITTD